MEELSVTFSPMTKVVKDKDGEVGYFTLIYNQVCVSLLDILPNLYVRVFRFTVQDRHFR